MSENSPTFERLRTLAENILRSQSTGEELHTDTEFKEVLHELQVYQIELEIQNEELRQAQEELATSRHEYSDLFEHAPVAYFIVDADGVIIKANSTAANKFGHTQAELHGMPFIHLIEINRRDTFYFHRRQLLKSHEAQTGELIFVDADGNQFYGQLESVLVDSDHDNRTFRAAVTDITQQKLYEQRLQALRELDQAILVSHSADEIVELVLDNVLQITPSFYTCFVDFYAEDDSEARFAFRNDASQTFTTKHFPAREFSAFRTLSNDEFHIKSSLPVFDTLLAADHAAHLIVPVFQSQRQVGILITGAKLESTLSQDIIRTVQDIALRMGTALQQAQMRIQIRRHTHDLETQVQERTADLRRSEQNERRQRVFAEAMLDIVQQLNRSLELDTVLEHILTSLERVIAFDNASIALINPQTGTIFTAHNRYQLDSNAARDRHSNVGDYPIYQHMLDTREPVFIPDVADSPHWLAMDGHESIKAYVGVPIIADDAVLGFLNVDKRETGYLSEAQFAHLHAFAAQAAIAIKNARAHQREQELAVLQERQRLARELHDAVSQNLFSINIMVQTLAVLLANDDHDINKIRDIFKQIEKTASGAQAEMRLLLFELRPSNMEQTTLAKLLQQLITGVRGRKTIEIHENLAPVPALPLEKRIMLYRMAQEGLNNVSKHANAKNAYVTLSVEDNNLIVLIEDDGRGFSIDEHPQGHGLAILHERASEIGAHLLIDSVEGKGTSIRIIYPLPEDAQSLELSDSENV